MRYTVGLFTNWYPTKENPYVGLFFKEQAFALEGGFDFLVFHFRQHIKRPFSRRFTIELSNEERNTKEYEVSVQIPIFVFLRDFLEMVLMYFFGKKRFDPKCFCTRHRVQYLKKIIQTACKQGFAAELDLLYCIDAQTEAGLIRMVAEATQKPYVVSEHAPFPWPGKVLAPFEKESIEKANAFLAISNDKIRQVMMQGVNLPLTRYVGNLVDEEHFTLKKENKDGHIKKLIIVAAYSFYKNYPMFIQIMNRLTEITEVPFRIMIVGYASNKGYSGNKSEFEQMISDSQFSDRVELIPEVPHDKVVEYLHQADAFVMTSFQEGQPVSAMEAACCGLPIFSTRCGGVEDYVTDEMGRLFSIVDVERFAWSLKSFLEGEIAFDSSTIRENVVHKFGKESFAKNMTDIFCEAILSDK